MDRLVHMVKNISSMNIIIHEHDDAQVLSLASSEWPKMLEAGNPLQ